MKRHLLSFTLGCTICLEPTLAFGGTTNPSMSSSVSGASISGAVMYQASGGAVTTITGQITLPQNYYYSAGATVTYTPDTTTGVPTSLTLTPDPGSILVVNTSTSISAQTSAALNTAFSTNNLPAAISIIRAAAGANGLE